MARKQFSDVITFTRTSGATRTSPDGTIVGTDFSGSPHTASTGIKTFVLEANGGINRHWSVSDRVLVSQVDGAITLTGTVEYYDTATQRLRINVSSFTSTGSASLWRIGSLMPRLDYDPNNLSPRGLLIEEQRTNLLTYSEQFSNAAWTALGVKNVTNNTSLSPDGQSTADTLTDNSNVQYQGIQQSYTISVNTTTYTFSIYVKKTTGGTSATFGINFGITGGTPIAINVRLNTDTGLILAGGPTAMVQNAGNYWRLRCSVTNNGTAGNTNLYVGIYPATATYGNGSDSVAATGSAVIWGAQLEAGAFTTSYIPTTSATATRAADTARVDTLSPWFNSSEGTLYFEGSHADSSNYPVGVVLSDSSTSSNQIILYTTSVGTPGETFFVRAAGAVQVNINGGSIAANNTIFRSAGAYKANDFVVSLNGSAVVTDTSGNIPTVDRMFLGSSTNQNNYWLNGYIRRIVYYPYRLSNATLQSITSLAN